ncbi:glycosyltransferase family 2 protein [Mucilaginibacter arboris]|uniref:Glycosyltransferase n=1 Tax=Mucilaginibacter arboris TaxID=2682090 RepID=A0A7K1SYW6_9SPHI|nr:glycosyltransferase family 2 protein [Mucilaginibacter arboris]MVN22230.1 glycosyltransferase [Mucilaginibacter arboris]
MVELVSVIIPNYNHARYLNQRIDSVLHQTYQNFEVIILDDCSTDDSKIVIEQYRNNPQIKHIIYNEKNSGSTFLQWEKGIALANGDYIWIAESDDYADKNFLESLTQTLNNNTNIGLAYCGSNMVDENGKSIGKLIQEIPNNQDGYYLNNGYDECRDAFFFHPIVPNASAVVFKKENFYKVDASFKQYKICGDWQFWIDICFDNYIAYFPECLNYFRQSNTSVSRSDHYRKDTYKIFLLEKLKVGLYAYKKVGNNIPLKHKVKYTDIYLFSVLLETSRKRIFLTRPEIVFITKSLFYLSPTAILVFFKSLTDVCLFGLRKVNRKIREKMMLKTA